jgi:hypothetical protein
MLQTVAYYGGKERKYFAPNIGNRSEWDTCFFFFFRMTDTMMTQNIDLSSWDILHMHYEDNGERKAT